MFKNFITSEILDELLIALKYIYWAMPVWLPAIFISFLFKAFLDYKRLKYWQKEGSVLLEIKLPKEISKSPVAMEAVLKALHQTGKEGTWVDRIWKGQTRPWFSLELVSTEGKVRFFIWTKPAHRGPVEAHIYSQYPNVEIHEVEDYTKPFYYDPNRFSMWAGGFGLTKEDAYPIKTYVDYNLDKDPKEEFKIDPMTPMLEFLGSIKTGEHIWIQILIRGHKKRRIADVFGEKEDAWKDQAKKEVEAIIAELKIESSDFPRVMTEGERDKITALERSISKYPFDCGIRAIYIAEKDKFNGANIGGIIGLWKQYSSPELNGIKPSGWQTIFDYPWQEWFGKKEKLAPKALDEYKLRRFFHSPLKGQKVWGKNIYSSQFVLNTEELATIFHFPGATASTPTLEKIPSLKSNAPSNLPT
ncbi:MAG: hypothetical protein GX627_02815 [Parcubacteria group bacterium]|jgi:hypothetical protein|nr:hypothetical protein [Parcubacteria group bacterium]